MERSVAEQIFAKISRYVEEHDVIVGMARTEPSGDDWKIEIF